MKRVIAFAAIVLPVVFSGITAFAGSVPEDLLSEDGAKVFFAKVTAYTAGEETPRLTYSATKRIKGDVIIGEIEEAYRPNLVGDFDIEIGKEYLFTYFDENNDTDIFEVTSTDTAELKLKNTEADIWKRFEKYLNEGEYEEAEQERMKRLGLLSTLEENADTPNSSGTDYYSCETLAEVFMVDRAEVEELSIVYSGGADPIGCQINKEDFFDMAEKIPLNQHTSLKKTDSKKGFMLVAADSKGNTYGVWADKDGRVANSQFETSSAVMTRYEMSEEDFERLCQSFLPKEAADRLKHGAVGVWGVSALAISLAAVSAVALTVIKTNRRKKMM